MIPLPQAQGSSGSLDCGQSDQRPASAWPEGEGGQADSAAGHWHRDAGSSLRSSTREVRDGSPCLMDQLLGCSREELMAMLVDKQEEVRDSSVCDNSGLQSGGADDHVGGQTGRGERQ